MGFSLPPSRANRLLGLKPGFEWAQVSAGKLRAAPVRRQDAQHTAELSLRLLSRQRRAHPSLFASRGCSGKKPVWGVMFFPLCKTLGKKLESPLRARSLVLLPPLPSTAAFRLPPRLLRATPKTSLQPQSATKTHPRRSSIALAVGRV